jgi:hyperosmotically inducible periplasmic protein
MNARIVVLTSALAAACGGLETRPAQDPASASTTAAPSDQNGTAVSNSPSNSGTYPMTAETQTPAATDSAGTTRRGEQRATTGVTNRTPDSSAVVAPSASAPVVNNPGGADQTKNADNTKINDRDRHGALTPMDQGNSGAETKITAAIRRGIMSDKTLSFTAKNVKVITIGNRVTLRGPVKSDQEKAAIEVLAKQTDGVSEVDDQLEVKK